MREFPKIETNTVEFKEKLTDGLEKEVVAFLNSEKGGDIYIGISNNGEVIVLKMPMNSSLK